MDKIKEALEVRTCRQGKLRVDAAWRSRQGLERRANYGLPDQETQSAQLQGQRVPEVHSAARAPGHNDREGLVR